LKKKKTTLEDCYQH